MTRVGTEERRGWFCGAGVLFPPSQTHPSKSNINYLTTQPDVEQRSNAAKKKQGGSKKQPPRKYSCHLTFELCPLLLVVDLHVVHLCTGCGHPSRVDGRDLSVR
jgi:hypothetical protein